MRIASLVQRTVWPPTKEGGKGEETRRRRRRRIRAGRAKYAAPGEAKRQTDSPCIARGGPMRHMDSATEETSEGLLEPDLTASFALSTAPETVREAAVAAPATAP